MADPGVLRLRVFQPSGVTAVVDARIRDVIGPAITASPGLVAFYPGRRGLDARPERVLATIWESAAALEAASRRPDAALDGPDDLGPSSDLTLPLRIDLRADTRTAPAVLRVFRGVIRPGEVDRYLDAARDGALADMAAGHGPDAYFVALTGEAEFVAVSAWADWDRISAATGGSVDRPIATRNVQLLASGTAAHYEILPHAIAAPPRQPTLVD